MSQELHLEYVAIGAVTPSTDNPRRHARNVRRRRRSRLKGRTRYSGYAPLGAGAPGLSACGQ